MVKDFKPLRVKTAKGNSTVYNINYHILFCPKYRKEVLMGKIKDQLQLIFESVCATHNWKIIELSIMSDHIHLFISAHPKHSPMEIVKQLKGVSARLIFHKNPEFKKKEFWGGHLWGGGYYIGTAGIVTAEAIQKYIEANSSKV